MSFTARPTEVLTLPLPSNAIVLHPERVILRFVSECSIDVGAICYGRRTGPKNGGASSTSGSKAERLVAESSLDTTRLNPVRKVIEYCSAAIRVGGKRPHTVHSCARELIVFLEWADTLGYDFALQGITVARRVAGAYIEHLREKVRLGQLSNNTAAISQMHVLEILAEVLDTDSLSQGLNLLRIDKYGRQSTQPPSEEEQARMLALCQCIFDGFTDLVLNRRPYPYKLPVPKYLGAIGDALWTFPSKKWCMPPHELSSRDSLNSGYWAMDYVRGRIATAEEIWHKYVFNPQKQTRTAHADLSIKSATKALAAANSDHQDRYRRNAALLAHNVFLILFLANTGMNWTTVRQLGWGNEFEVGVERQGFRTVKYRAAGRLVSFEIQAVFMPVFKRFLELRAYLLNGREFEFLFLAGGNFVKTIEALNVKTLSSIVDSLQRIDPAMPSIMSRQWRAGKSDWLLRNVDPATAAIILQNSEQTVLRSYAEGSPTTQLEEMGSFLDQLQNAVLAKDVSVANGTASALGVCSSYGNPHQVFAAPIASDCRGLEGCLFCDKFKVHADAQDTRKLVSCRYCLQQTAHMTTSEEQFQSLFGPIFARIEVLLGEIDRREIGLVQRIVSEVDAGELDPYWARKMEMLIDLELVI